ncbi:hypothetical protein ROR02_31470 [Pararhodospirillum oryzae]|uniref:Uncharacterized protein n=1 Tax=Pararhodospirillum oryzae TaxID=478448 RepID=A0A512HC43_9PROT|nr:hypothetical protein ROR02_31470 [Pararhodospirillum oryzae]
MHKLQEEDTGVVYYTNVACELLDVHSGRCIDYARRWRTVPDCVKLSARHLDELTWLPETCAYRLLAQGMPLPPWHPLESGSPDSVHHAGMSVRGRTIPEDDAGPLEDHIVDWNDL